MAEENSPKWQCEYCTFLNWQAAKKCTICQAPKRPKFIFTDTQTPAPDIYQVATESEPASSSTLPGTVISRQTPNSRKWSCSKCTYMNWDKSRKCVVCHTSNHNESLPQDTSESSNHLIAAMQPLSVNTKSNDSEPAQAGYSSKRNSPNSASGESNRHSSPAFSPNDSRNGKNTMASTYKSLTNKWTCKGCTYENWPKANICSICRSARERLSSRNKTVPISPPTSPRGAAASSSLIRNNKPPDRFTELDRLFLKACVGILEGDHLPVDSYLAFGGDASRCLTAEEISMIGHNSANIQSGHSMVHLAVQSEREDILALLVTATVTKSKTKKRLPPHVCPDLAGDLLRGIAVATRQRKGEFPCLFLTELATFVLPSDVGDLVPAVESQLLNDILDHSVQRELEVEESIINWNVELNEVYGSRLYALWNRSAGDCLLDSVLQATWGVFDNDNTLRRALYDSLNEGAQTIKPRWREYETCQAQLYQFTLDDNQWAHDWEYILSLANQPGSSLDQTHIFTLAHILRRPIIVYGVKYIKTFRGETIDLAKFQGIYLPLLWESNFCWKSPIALGYTRGHFSALVATEVEEDCHAGAGAAPDVQDQKVVYLPLVDKDNIPLPLHFLSKNQLRRQGALLTEWLKCRHVGGVFCAEQPMGRQPPLVTQMVDEWMERYRSLSQAMTVAGMGRKRKSTRVSTISVPEEFDETDEE